MVGDWAHIGEIVVLAKEGFPLCVGSVIANDSKRIELLHVVEWVSGAIIINYKVVHTVAFRKMRSYRAPVVAYENVQRVYLIHHLAHVMVEVGSCSYEPEG